MFCFIASVCGGSALFINTKTTLAGREIFDPFPVVLLILLHMAGTCLVWFSCEEFVGPFSLHHVAIQEKNQQVGRSLQTWPIERLRPSNEVIRSTVRKKYSLPLL